MYDQASYPLCGWSEIGIRFVKNKLYARKIVILMINQNELENKLDRINSGTLMTIECNETVVSKIVTFDAVLFFSSKNIESENLNAK